MVGFGALAVRANLLVWCCVVHCVLASLSWRLHFAVVVYT